MIQSEQYQPTDRGHDEASRKRGFAALSAERRKEIARIGGQAAHAQGTAHQFSPDEARLAGQRGGATTGQDRDHMAAIGRRGGSTTSQDRQRMADLGRLGGTRRAARLRERLDGQADADGAG